MINKFIWLIFIFSIIATGIAQNNHAKGLAFGNNYLSPATGIDAFFLNPANLAYNTKGVEFTFLSPSLGISNSVFSSFDYGKYVSEKGHDGFWSTGDKKEIRDLIKDGISVPFGAEVNLFSMVYKNMGFGIQLISSGAINTNSAEFAEIALFGLELTPDYNFNQKGILDGSFYSAIEYSFAYSHLLRKRYFPLKLEDITLGAKLSYYSGLAYAEVEDSDLKIKRSNPEGSGFEKELVEYQFKGKAKTALPGDGNLVPGGGLSLDIASSAVFDDDWHLSVMIENIFGFISWGENTKMQTFSISDSVYIFDDDGIDRSSEVDTTIDNKSFTSFLPTSLYLGAHYQLLKNLMLTASYKQGFNERFGNVFTPQLGVGAEYRPLKWLPLRTGMTVGGPYGFLLGLGTGVDVKVFEFNLAYAMRKSLLWPNWATGAYLAFDFKFKL